MKKLVFFLIILFACPVYAANVTLVWDANTEMELAGYKVYMGTSSRNYGPPIDVGNVTTYTFTDLATDEQTLYFAVTAYIMGGLESGFSNEVNTGGAIPPPPPPLPPPPGECVSGPYVLYLGGLGGGWIATKPVCPSYAKGQVISLTGIPNNTTVRFDHWSGDVSGSINPLSYTFSGSKMTLGITANFVPAMVDQLLMPPGNFRIFIR